MATGRAARPDQRELQAMLTTTLVERLRALDTPAVSDALDRMNRSGVVTCLSAVSVAKRIAGRAVTVQLGPAQQQNSSRHLCTAAVDASGPDDIIVIAHGGRTDVAGWGGILSLGAVSRKIGGIVIDGACRDTDESRELGLPVYARASVPITARGRIVEQFWNEPVRIAEVTVAPGDLVIADASGVVFIPIDLAEKIIGIAEEIAARERAMASAVRSGRLMAEVMGAQYETMLTNKSMP
jgi:regulator of RNase E activity RraA